MDKKFEHTIIVLNTKLGVINRLLEDAIGHAQRAEMQLSTNLADDFAASIHHRLQRHRAEITDTYHVLNDWIAL